jgi:hypothetical protein
MKYRVLRNCDGFMGRYWEKDAVVDIDPALNPPEHFKLLEVPVVVPPVEEKEAPIETEVPAEPEPPVKTKLSKAKPKAKKRSK